MSFSIVVRSTNEKKQILSAVDRILKIFLVDPSPLNFFLRLENSPFQNEKVVPKTKKFIFNTCFNVYHIAVMSDKRDDRKRKRTHSRSPDRGGKDDERQHAKRSKYDGKCNYCRFFHYYLVLAFIFGFFFLF